MGQGQAFGYRHVVQPTAPYRRLWWLAPILLLLLGLHALQFLAAGAPPTTFDERAKPWRLGAWQLYLLSDTYQFGVAGTAWRPEFDFQVQRRWSLHVGRAKILLDQQRWAGLDEMRACLVDSALGTIYRQNAISLLAAVGDREAVDYLQRIALTEEEPPLRRAATSALGRLEHGPQHASVVDTLCQALSDRDAVVREEAARSLGRLGAREAGDALYAAMEDYERPVRAAATAALATLGVEDEQLYAWLDDRADEVRLEAALALGDDEAALETMLDSVDATRGRYDRRVLDAMIRYRPMTGQTLVERWLDGTGVNRRALALSTLVDHPTWPAPDTLWEIKQGDGVVFQADRLYPLALAARAVRGDNTARQNLLATASGSSVWDRRYAQLALARMADPRMLAWIKQGPGQGPLSAQEFESAAVECLRADAPLGLEMVLNMARRPDLPRLREAACRYLGKHGAREAMPVLAQALQDDDWEVRVTAAGAIGALTGQALTPSVDGVALAQAWLQRQ